MKKLFYIERLSFLFKFIISFKLFDFFQMILYILNRKYSRKRGVFIFILLIIYLFSPLDFIPDFLPFLGIIDDLLILKLGLNALKKEVEYFSIWQQKINKIYTIE